MAVLWENGPMTVSQIQSKLSEPLHYNTVSTFVRGLEAYGLVTHERKGNGYVYMAEIDRNEYLTAAIGQFVKIFFQNDKDAFHDYLLTLWI